MKIAIFITKEVETEAAASDFVKSVASKISDPSVVVDANISNRLDVQAIKDKP